MPAEQKMEEAFAKTRFAGNDLHAARQSREVKSGFAVLGAFISSLFRTWSDNFIDARGRRKVPYARYRFCRRGSGTCMPAQPGSYTSSSWHFRRDCTPAPGLALSARTVAAIEHATPTTPLHLRHRNDIHPAASALATKVTIRS